MNDEELKKIWQQLDTRISTLNDRTKAHTIQLENMNKEIKLLKNYILIKGSKI
jgi:chaperonin cofactor prefoldin